MLEKIKRWIFGVRCKYCGKRMKFARDWIMRARGHLYHVERYYCPHCRKYRNMIKLVS